MIKKNLILVFLWMSSQCLPAQAIHPDILQKKWKAFWISVPGEPEKNYGVYKFRKTITLAEKPHSFTVHVSADNRYKLYVNGSLASLGPARSDPFHWNFETLDIAPYLKSGKNIIGAVVWNFGELRPEAQMSFRTAFILQGNSATEEIVNTGKDWKCILDESYAPLTPELLYTYYVSGPGERVDFFKHISGWEQVNYDDSSWKAAQQINNGIPKGVFDWSSGWMLVPREIPPMELSVQRLISIRKADGLTVPSEFPKEKVPITVPPNKKVVLWLDQGHLTNAYPVVHFSKGRDASIKLTYAESLYKIENTGNWRAEKQKGNRNEIKGKRFVGVRDELTGNGQSDQIFTSLSWRTYRYVQIEVETQKEALVIDDVYGIFTGYPFQLAATFGSSDKVLDDIFSTGWRTGRMCAVETYMDCPYYEQLQYVGDTRIQALVSLFNSGDDRLMRNAITQIDHSRLAEGVTQSRYPTAHVQVIPTFSLWWIAMVHDYWWYRQDTAFVKKMLPGMRQVLNFFAEYQQPDGSLKNIPYWPFTDWVREGGWQNGMPPMGSDNSSAIFDMQFCWVLQMAAELEEDLGMLQMAASYRNKAEQLKQTIRKKYFNTGKQLFADTQEKKLYSQHTNTLAVLCKVAADDEVSSIMEKVLSDTTLTQATIYFKYYVHQAASKAGFGNRYLELLGDWKEQLRNGLTTWAEISDHNNARSDCHAWGASPNIEFFRIVLGVDSDAPGFSRIKIEPHLGDLTRAEGRIPHPNGEVSARYAKEKTKWKVEIQIPAATSGILSWNEKQYDLKPGVLNTFEF